MAASHFRKLDEEGRALHDSWEHIARIVFLVTALSGIVWAVVSGIRWAAHHASHAVVHLSELGVLGALGMLAVLALGGAIRVVLARRPAWKDAEGDGMDVALHNYHVTYDDRGDDPSVRYERPAFALAGRKAAATVVSLGTGASGGLEAPSVLIAEGLSAGFARIMRVRSEHELRTYQLAGIAGAVATLLNAPFSAALFATEVVYGDRIIYRKLAYALWAGVIAYILSNRVRGYHPLFEAPSHPPVYTLGEYGAATAVALAVSVPLALGFAWAVGRARMLAERLGSYGPIYACLGIGCVALLLQYAAGVSPSHVLGMGEETIAAILRRDAAVSVWWVLTLTLVGKVLTTGLSISAGHSVGLLIPTMYLGGVSGALVAVVMNAVGATSLDPALFAVVGISSSLVAVIGVPISAVALVLEVFGSTFGPPAILACGVTYLVTLRIKVYATERVVVGPPAAETDPGPP